MHYCSDVPILCECIHFLARQRHHFVTRVIFNHPILVMEPEETMLHYHKHGYVFRTVPLICVKTN